MILELLIVLPVGAIVLAYASGRSIPTPIPAHLAERGSDMATGSLLLTLYRVTLVVLALGASWLAIAANPTGLVAFLTAGVVAWLIMDDLTATLIDVWNANFWRVDA